MKAHQVYYKSLKFLLKVLKTTNFKIVRIILLSFRFFSDFNRKDEFSIFINLNLTFLGLNY